MENMRIAACFLSSVSLLLLIVALASDYWEVDSKGGVHAGLWRACRKEFCAPLGMKAAGYMHTPRAFLLLGMGAGTVSFFGLCASFFYTHVGSVSINHLAVLASFGAGIGSLIATSTFTGVDPDVMLFLGDSQYGWSFGLGWASFPLFFITGGLAYKTQR